MRSLRVVSIVVMFTWILGLLPGTAVGAQTLNAPGSSTRQIPAGGTTSIRGGAEGTDGLQQPELKPGATEDEGAGSFNRPRPGLRTASSQRNPLTQPPYLPARSPDRTPSLSSALTV